MKKYYLKAEQLSVGYGKKPVVRELELQVKRGEILTLIGPNGAGKSTVLKSIARQLSVMSGTIYLDGQELSQMSGKVCSEKMSVVLTERIQSELMTCEDVVSSGRHPYTGRLGILSDEDRQKVAEALELVHAADLAACYYDEISDGQRQRILLARAICQEPEIIVLDEPTSFLDIRHKMELLGILKRLVKEQELAVIMSLHELDLAQKVSDRIVCIQGGSVVRAGTPEEIFEGDFINTLYGVEKGSFLAALGCLELEPSKGDPEVFVIGGGGEGIALYHKLQRKGIPFAAGVLAKSDADYAIAKALAVRVIEEESFEPVSEAAVQQALSQMKECSAVLCAVSHFGTMNGGNAVLKQEAERLHVLQETAQFFKEDDA